MEKGIDVGIGFINDLQFKINAPNILFLKEHRFMNSM